MKRKYVCVLNTLLKHPPIRHRGEPPEAGLSVAETVTAIAVTALARDGLAAARHAFARRVGREAIKKERARPTKALNQFKVTGVAYQFKVAGAAGYLEGQDAFDRNASDEFVIEISRSGLLRAASVARKGQNVAGLPDVLHRLKRPVRVGRHELPPLLLNAKTLPSGKLRLRVNGRWVPRRKFDRVPWPAPTSGPTVLALYLFLFGADLRSTSRVSMRAVSLYRRLGIPLSRPAHAQRSLDRALDHVNAHLKVLDKTALAELGVKVPTAFELLPIDGGVRVRIRPVYEKRRRPARHEAQKVKTRAETESQDVRAWAAERHRRSAMSPGERDEIETFDRIVERLKA